MSTKRPGVDASLILYKHNNIKLWNKYYNYYNDAVELVSINKKKNELIGLDHWLWVELENNVYNRNRNQSNDINTTSSTTSSTSSSTSTDYYLTKEELSNVMKWKLIRGKFRPLQGLVDSNTQDAVRSCTTKALNILCNNNNKKVTKSQLDSDWKLALKELIKLRGIGVATASAILALFNPENCVFMADEVIDTVHDGKRDYTLPVYVSIQSKLYERMHILNSHVQPPTSNISTYASNTHIPLCTLWNMEMMGKAIWTAAVFSSIDDIIVTDTNDTNTNAGPDPTGSPNTNTRKKRKI